MYLHWVRPCIAIIIIVLLIYLIYWMTRTIPEGFAISSPPQKYTIPALKGVPGRYVRIRPSTTGDGYLSISQIQVIDINGRNVALEKPVTATSTGGSPLDQKYGKNILSGGVYQYVPGFSADPSAVVDGITAPRWGLTNIFETGEANSPADTEYLEIDLSGSVTISSVIYTGRADPLKATYTTYEGEDMIDQVTRLTGMRLEILDTNKVITFNTTFNDDPITHVTTINISTTLFTVNPELSAAATIISVPNVASYKNIATVFRATDAITDANKNLIKQVNANYTAVNTASSATTLQYTFDISGGLFQALVADYPISFYNDIYSMGCPATNCKANKDKPTQANPQIQITYQGPVRPDLTKYDLTLPPLVPNLDATVFGTASAAAQAEMTASIEYCKSIFLGSPGNIENYIRLTYSPDVAQIKPYIRNQNTKFWCMPDLMQVFTSGSFVTQVAAANQAWNQGKCSRELTPTVLALLPYATRNFVIEWIRNRTIRYIRYYNLLPSSTVKKNEEAERMVVPSIGIATTSPMILDAIAQQFYEMLGGDFIMSYIYDVLPLGTTMLDVRFDLMIHGDPTTSYAPIAALKAQYAAFIQNGKTLPENIIDQASVDYENSLSDAQQGGINNVNLPFEGAVARLFYTATGGTITLTGMIFDDKAVTSFIPELNGGLVVPLGPQDGNVNYTPKIVFNRNQPVSSVNCRDPTIIRGMMNDYMKMVQADKKILLSVVPQVDTSEGSLFVTKVTGATQISPTQCAIDWVETVYDPVTNRQESLSPENTDYVSNICKYTEIKRRGILSYYIDMNSWYAQDPVFAGMAGFKLFNVPQGMRAGSPPPIPACQFDITTYNASVGNRFSALGAISSTGTNAQKVTNDFVNTTVSKGGPICPQTIPMYTFNTTDYVAAGGGASGLSDYTTKLAAGANPIVKNAFIVEPLTTPIIYTKPLPAEINLTNASGVCPTSSCTDLDVLYDLVTQYNENPSLPGTIMNVQRAYTAGSNQCDIEGQINFDAMINNVVGEETTDPVTGLPSVVYPMVKKGTVDYEIVNRKAISGSKAMSLSGVQTVNMALYVDIDKSNCSYLLADASGVDSGYTIQPNTPFLYKPMNYALELQARTAAGVGSSIAQIQSDFTKAAGSAKKALTNYRVNTYSAIGSINTLACNRTCHDIAVSLQNYYNSNNTIAIQSIINVGTFNSNTCDLTVRDSTQQQRGIRFTVDSSCTPRAFSSINASPAYSDIQNTNVPLSAALPAVSGFQNFVQPPTDEAYPLKAPGFGLDRRRNGETFKEIQYTVPLKQEFSVKEEGGLTTYKFIRFVPVKVREGSTVDIQRLTFFYGGQPLRLSGRVTNPMGTWEGGIEDVTGPRATGWTDRHKKPLVFAFKTGISIDGYSFTTGPLARNDPVAWKLEGSSNGSFWTLLDSQDRFPTPIERGKDVQMISLT
jgi:hypothetical protein